MKQDTLLEHLDTKTNCYCFQCSSLHVQSIINKKVKLHILSWFSIKNRGPWEGLMTTIMKAWFSTCDGGGRKGKRSNQWTIHECESPSKQHNVSLSTWIQEFFFQDIMRHFFFFSTMASDGWKRWENRGLWIG